MYSLASTTQNKRQRRRQQKTQLQVPQMSWNQRIHDGEIREISHKVTGMFNTKREQELNHVNKQQRNPSPFCRVFKNIMTGRPRPPQQGRHTKLPLSLTDNSSLQPPRSATLPQTA